MYLKCLVVQFESTLCPITVWSNNRGWVNLEEALDQIHLNSLNILTVIIIDVLRYSSFIVTL